MNWSYLTCSLSVWIDYLPISNTSQPLKADLQNWKQNRRTIQIDAAAAVLYVVWNISFMCLHECIECVRVVRLRNAKPYHTRSSHCRVKQSSVSKVVGCCLQWRSDSCVAKLKKNHIHAKLTCLVACKAKAGPSWAFLKQISLHYLRLKTWSIQNNLPKIVKLCTTYLQHEAAKNKSALLH